MNFESTISEHKVTVRITLYQQNVCWLSPSSNYADIESALAAHSDSDVLVLPEMCTTGFVTEPHAGQLEASADVERRLLGLAARFDCAICGSFAVTDEGKNYNRCLFATPEGSVYRYDKRHTFNPGGEGRSYTAGQERMVVSYRGVRFLLLVCYDLRFPVWSRYAPDCQYDVLLCVANWPEQRMLAWDTLLRARAIENQVYVVGVNRVGVDPMCPYRGGSAAIHPYGHVLASCADNEATTCTFVPDMEQLGHYREKFPSQADSDAFTIAP